MDVEAIKNQIEMLLQQAYQLGQQIPDADLDDNFFYALDNAISYL
jgi:hypothetical protein